MESSKEKQFKEQINEALHTACNPERKSSDREQSGKEKLPNTSTQYFTSETALERSLGNESFKRIKDIFEKTEAMKEVAKEKNQQLEQQFKFLKQKLSSSSECLLRIKKNIENLKFSYQKNILEMHKSFDPGEILDSKNDAIKTREDMARHMEDIRNKIENLQNRMTAQREKQQYVTESYQETFERVVDTLQEIEEGSYSSQDLRVVKD